MSSTYPLEILSIRRLLRDRQVSDPVVPGAQLEELIGQAIDEVHRDCGGGDILTTNFATVGANASSVTVSTPGAAGLRYLKELVRQSDGAVVVPVPYEQIVLERQYGGSNFGQPYWYALRMDNSANFTLEVYPTPQTGETFDARWQPIPSAVATYAGTIALSNPALVVLRQRVAARAILSMDQSMLAKLGLTRDYAQDLMGQAAAGAADEWSRVHQGDLQDYVVRTRRS